ncbi:MAG: hypothetical protein IT383_18415 [Deltaproteobacteria bacterium]|nr:hypothetical protein [Deltaproteobacteria bacterium]
MESSLAATNGARKSVLRWAALAIALALLVAAVALLVRRDEVERAEAFAPRRDDEAGSAGTPHFAGGREVAPAVNDPGGKAEAVRTLFPERALVDGIIRTGAGSAGVLESANRRVLLVPGEHIEIRLRPSTSGAAVTVRADDGGVINGLQLQPQVELPAATTSFAFAAGGHRGLYTVTITRGDELQILEAWVGNEAPTGRAGPPRQIELPRNIVADTSEHP